MSPRILFPGCRSAVAALALAMVGTAAAAPQPAFEQVPGVYRHAIGELQVTALFDGVIHLPRQRLSAIEPERFGELLQRRFVPETSDGVQTAVNAYLVRTDKQLVLVDTGAAQCFGPSLGHVQENLRQAGQAPEQVDVVLLTHAHPDHLCGLLDGEGRPAYPNATVWLATEDADFWLDPASEAKVAESMRPMLQMARRAVAPYEATGRLRRFKTGDFKAGDTLPAGLTAVPSRGHTPGHTSYLFDGGKGERLLVWGDIVHFHAVQFVQPEASFEYDADRAQAIATRRALLKEVATKRWWVAGAHLPFPGLGHVGSDGAAYTWVPAEFSPVPDGR